MAQYDVYVFCNDCSDVHKMGIVVALEDGPAEKQSIGNLFAGEELPSHIANVMHNMTVCPKTGKAFTQEDNNQVFLVPMSG
jgi:hypothetical protein